MRTTVRVGLCVAVVLAVAAPTAAQYKYPFQDPSLPIERRVDNILKLMTVGEKIDCLGTDPEVPRLDIHGTGHVEGLHGLAMGGPGGWGKPRVVPTTQFPQAVGLGETWDPELLRRAAAVEAYEARFLFQSPKYHQGGLVVRAPNADLARDPRWGRTEESYGEDAFFNGTMAVSFIRGLQGSDPQYWMTAALMKHFLANSNEDGRGSSSSDFDPRLLHEYYAVPFRMGIEAGGSRAFMTAYNAYDGVPMAVNPIVRDLAIRQWGNDGIVCTDAGALTNLVTQFKRYPTIEEAAAASVKTGINQFLDTYKDGTRIALNKGLLTEADIDERLRGVFRVMIRLGLLDPPDKVPYTTIKDGPDPWTLEQHKALARLVTQKSIVLLKNSRHALPLDRRSLKSIAMIGPYADRVLLDWYSGTPPYTVSPLEGIRNKVGNGVAVTYAAGGAAAVNAAKASEVAIVVVGNHPECDAPWAQCPLPSDGKESIDRKSITLEQEDLVKQVFEANPRTIVVLISSFPYAINWTEENVPAIVHMSHNSQEEGTALADVLFGDVNPGGKLVHTWPRSLKQLPAMMDYDLRHGRTYMYLKNEPLYPFGYGLSYTSFEFSHLRLSSMKVGSDDTVTVTADVRNTGDRAGDEVVQMYVSYPASKVERPLLLLKGFQRVSLAAGESATVKLPLSARSLAYWDDAKGAFTVEDGAVTVMVGNSSARLPLKATITITR